MKLASSIIFIALAQLSTNAAWSIARPGPSHHKPNAGPQQTWPDDDDRLPVFGSSVSLGGLSHDAMSVARSQDSSSNKTSPPTPRCPGTGHCRCGWATARTCRHDDGSECNIKCCCSIRAAHNAQAVRVCPNAESFPRSPGYWEPSSKPECHFDCPTSNARNHYTDFWLNPASPLLQSIHRAHVELQHWGKLDIASSGHMTFNYFCCQTPQQWSKIKVAGSVFMHPPTQAWARLFFSSMLY